VEESGLVYAYGENYCYMPAPLEMKRLYEQGEIGEFEYGEGEYIHNCEAIWPSIAYGDPDHWRNNSYATFYCTHSLGPILHATGLRPVSVVGFEGTRNARSLRVGRKCGQFGIEMVTLENGGMVKSIHGDLYKNSIWYSMYGSKGRMESSREDTEDGYAGKLYINRDEYDGGYETGSLRACYPEHATAEDVAGFGHGGSDFFSMYYFIKRILGDETAETIDVYEALDMFLPGLFAYRSILAGGIPMAIPDLRDREERERWRGDTACTDPKAAGDMLVPTLSKGTPTIPQEVYDRQAALWAEECAKTEGTYRQAALTQGSK
jgi:predicted dehydrogenase